MSSGGEVRRADFNDLLCVGGCVYVYVVWNSGGKKFRWVMFALLLLSVCSPRGGG